MNITIDAMTFSDIISIESNFTKSFDKFWSVNILKEDFKNENSKYIIAKISDEVVGFAGIKIALDEADIMNIAVRVDFRNLGIGSMLLQKLIELATNNCCSTITLEVNENNLFAIRLYEKYRFKRIAFRKKYYNNTDNAIIMQKKLGGLTNEK